MRTIARYALLCMAGIFLQSAQADTATENMAHAAHSMGSCSPSSRSTRWSSRRPWPGSALSAYAWRGFDQIRFAWLGGLDRGERHCDRILGPTFIIEYDNTQDDANHIHSVWRDFDGDLGIDLLEQHYRNSKHHQQ